MLTICHHWKKVLPKLSQIFLRFIILSFAEPELRQHLSIKVFKGESGIVTAGGCTGVRSTSLQTVMDPSFAQYSGMVGWTQEGLKPQRPTLRQPRAADTNQQMNAPNAHPDKQWMTTVEVKSVTLAVLLAAGRTPGGMARGCGSKTSRIDRSHPGIENPSVLVAALVGWKQLCHACAELPGIWCTHQEPKNVCGWWWWLYNPSQMVVRTS